jgi:predicted nucleic-acid-binding protein
MNVGLDTSVVLRLLIGQPEIQAARAVAFLDELHRKKIVPIVSDLVVAEVYFALQHHYGIAKVEALNALRELFADGEIQSTGAAASVLSQSGLHSAKPGFVDRLIHAGYIGETTSVATFEKAGAKLKGVRVL